MKTILTIALILFCSKFSFGQEKKLQIKFERDKTDKVSIKSDTIEVLDVAPKEVDYNIRTSFSQLVNGSLDNNFWIDVDKDKQILNFSLAQWNLGSFIGNFKGSFSNVNTPLFSESWNPRDWSGNANINWFFNGKRFYGIEYKKDTCIKKSNCDGMLCIDFQESNAKNRYTTFEYFHWINFNPQYNRNTYDFVPRVDSLIILSQEQTVESFDFSVSYNFYAQWKNLNLWTPQRRFLFPTRSRPNFVFASVGFESKTQTNVNDLDEWDIETERVYNDAVKGESRKKKNASSVYYGDLTYSRINQAFVNLSIGFAGNLVFDVKHKQSIGTTTYQNWETQFTFGGKFNNSEGEVKTVTGLYVKYINNWNPVFGITTKFPF